MQVINVLSEKVSSKVNIRLNTLLTDNGDGFGSRRKLIADDNLIDGHRQQNCHGYK